MRRATRWSMASLLLLSLAPGLRSSAALDRPTRLSVMSAVVQISLVRLKEGRVYHLPWGSGTIISSDGLILTNCHVADPIRFGLPADQMPDFDYLGVSLTVRSDRPPQLSYLAEVLQADPTLDLAVVRVTKRTDLTPVGSGDLNLPYVELGDSDAVEVGDDLNIFGYPTIGGETVTFTKGVVSGFALEASVPGRAWIKTDAAVSGGNSGGTGVDDHGLLVGVPTRAGIGDEAAFVDCRPVKDTNGDGRVDASDDCVPVGGFINALRPVNLAKPLVEAARRGFSEAGGVSPAAQGEQPAGAARLSNLFFAPGVNEFGQPTTVVTSLPTGSRSLYLFFDYENMDKGKVLAMELFIDGEAQPDWTLPAGPWRGKKQGTWWIGWRDARFVDGTYEMVLSVDGQEMSRAEIRVGGPAQAEPTFSNLLLSEQATDEGRPLKAGVLFSAGTRELSGFFDFANLVNGQRWVQSWMKDGRVIASQEGTWQLGTSGHASVTLTGPQGLEPGAYRLSLWINGRLAALSDFWVTGNPGQGPSFGPVVFASGVDAGGQPAGTAQSFSRGLNELHAFSDYSGMEDGLAFCTTWYLDGQRIVQDPYEWAAGSAGTWHYYIYSREGPLPEGQYSVELQVSGQTLRTGSTSVGAGVSPTPVATPRPRIGVQVQGTIVDLDTARPIPGAVFLVLQPGITLRAFRWTSGELYTSAVADRQGYFRLPVLLQRGECYTMIIGADGYWAQGQDKVCIDPSGPSLLEVPVKLERK